jgi:hypothetical protein
MELPRTLRELLDAPRPCQVDKDRHSPHVTGNVSTARSGYRERMARARRPESARVPIGLKVSDADAARIDQVLARPEYAGWTRAEWCREIIRSALRYYVGDGPAPDPGQARTAARPAAAEPVSPSQSPPPTAANSGAPVVSASQADPPGNEPVPAAPESPAQTACPHPADARDYETGTCAACGAILWD